MKLIAGLGNPGSRYKDTRHNVGFMAIDAYLHHLSLHHFYPHRTSHAILTNQARFQSHLLKTNDTIFAKPQTYMNLSGEAIKRIVDYYDIKDVLIIHDDLDLPLGTIKIKFGGGNGGHNGLKSIDKCIGDKYTRIRIGITHPRDSSIDVVDYVLGGFDKNDFGILKKVFCISNNAIESFINDEKLLDLQNKYNKRV